MPDFVSRLMAERNELHDRIGKLRMFIESMPFNNIGKKQKHWLRKQLIVMDKYLLILNERLEDILEERT